MEEKVIAQLRATGCQGDVLSADADATVVQFRANNYHSTEVRNRRGIGLRLVADGRIGFSSTSDPARIDALVPTARELSRFGDQARFAFPTAAPLPTPRLGDAAACREPAALVQFGRELVAAFVARVPDLKVDLSLSCARSRTTIANSAGLHATYEKRQSSLSMQGLLIIDSSLIWVYDYANLTAAAPFDPAAFVARNGAIADQARRKADLRTGRYPVVFMPMAATDLLAALPLGVNGRMFQKKITPLLDREGQPIADSGLTVYDDPLLDCAAGSAPFDGDGVPARRIPVIERGIFKNFLFDLQTAGSVGRTSTASARRSYAGLPGPDFANLVVAPGSARLEDTIAGIREGLLVYALVGGGQSNLLAGDFSFDVSIGFKIEAGSIAGRVKGAMIAGNLYEVQRTIAGIGDTLTDLGTQHLPFIHFDSLSIAAKE